jgi:predicted DNA-binding transcriptional regulator AlpA
VSGLRALPRQVRLPGFDTINADHLRIALGVSRSVLHRWRKDHGFPKGYRCGNAVVSLEAEVAQWLRAHGVEVVE